MSEELMERLKAFFEENHGKTFYPDDVAEALDTSLWETIEACEKLAAGGKIAIVIEQEDTPQ
jgi:hypothetical protein